VLSELLELWVVSFGERITDQTGVPFSDPGLASLP